MLTLKLAWRNLFRNTRRTILTSMLIGFSLAALILTDAILLGMVKVMVESLTHTLAGEVQVHRKGFQETMDVDLYLENSGELEQRLARAPEVLAWTPRVITGGMISSPYNISSGLVYGVDADKEARVSRIEEAVFKGNYLRGNPGEILIGIEMADLLEVGLGDRIVITLAEVDSGELSQALFRVSGIFEFGMREFDGNMAFINLDKAREVLAMGDASHEIAIRLHDAEDANRIDQTGLATLAEGDDNVQVQGWKDFHPQIGSMIEMSSYSSLIVGAVLFLLASLGVVNSMFMSIYERVYEFGVTRAIGTKPTQIVRLVLSEAGLIGLVSVVLGALIGGLSGAWFADHGIPIGEFEVSGILVNTMPTVLDLRQFIDFPLYVIALTVIAAIYPAIYASRITPAEALQRTL